MRWVFSHEGNKVTITEDTVQKAVQKAREVLDARDKRDNPNNPTLGNKRQLLCHRASSRRAKDDAQEFLSRKK